MILSLTATAGHRFGAMADTSVIPTAKTSITNKPLAEKVEGKSPASGAAKSNGKPNTVKSANVTKKSNVPVATGTMGKKNTATEKVSTNTNKDKTEPAKKSTAKKTTASESGAAVKPASGAAKTNTATKNSTVIKTGTAAGSGKVSKTGTSAKNSTVTKPNTASNNSTAVKSGTNARSVKTAKTNTTTKSTTTTAKKTSLAGKKTAAVAPAETNKTTKNSKTKSHKLRKGIGIELYPPLAFKYAILLDVPVEKVTDGKLLEVLDHWYGTRYRYGGETRRGIDCSAFTQAFMRSYFDYELPRTSEEQFATCKHIKKRKLRQGDLVFFKTSGPKGGISHVGVYLVNNRFVHSATSTGVRISDLNDDYYKEKYAGAGRIR